MDADPADLLAALIDGKGERQYGLSAVNQRAHALQAALLAEQAGCSSALVTAALLHDIGHMVHGLGEDPAAEGVDDRHEQVGHDFLTALFRSRGDRTSAAARGSEALSVRCRTSLFQPSVAGQRAQPGAAGRPDVGGPRQRRLPRCRRPPRR